MKKIAINEKKFNTVTYEVRIYFEEDKYQSTKRNLLSLMLANCNAIYPIPNDWSNKLDSLYSSYYNVTTNYTGKYAYLTYRLFFMHPKYSLDNEYTLDYMYDFFMQIIGNPDLTKKNFELAKNELRNTLLQNMEDINYVSYNKTMDKYFNGLPSSIKKDGYYDEIDNISLNQITEIYNEMHLQERIFIAVGDIDGNDKLINDTIHENDLMDKNYYSERLINIEPKSIETSSFNQTAIHMIYDLNIFGDNDSYLTALILNYILGVSPSSKLFQSIREKAGMCYSIYSTYNSLNGIMIVTALIDEANVDTVSSLINKEVEAIGKGDFLDNDVTEAINFYVNHTLEYFDFEKSYCEVTVKEKYFKNTKTTEEVIELISKVTKNNVIEIAKNIKCNFMHVLLGKGE